MATGKRAYFVEKGAAGLERRERESHQNLDGVGGGGDGEME